MVLFFLGKVLIIGGSIANFTNVAATFKVQIVKLPKTKYKYMFCVISIHLCKYNLMCMCVCVGYCQGNQRLSDASEGA